MTAASDVPGHYTSGDLLPRLEARLREDGFDPACPTFDALAPYDHFHGRGLEATEDMANLLQISEIDQDSGCRQRPRRTGALLRPALRLPGQRNRSDGRVLRRRPAPDIAARARGTCLHRAVRCAGDAVRRCDVRRRLLDERLHEHCRQACAVSRDSPHAQTWRLARFVRSRSRAGWPARLPDAVGADRLVELSRDQGGDPREPRGLGVHDRGSA